MASRSDFAVHLAAGEWLPVYALVSPSPLLVAEAVAALRGRVLTGPSDFNRDEFVAGEGGAARVVQAAATLPMMAARRWVHVAGVQRLKAADQAVLLTYLDKPCPTTVLCVSADKLDGRLKLGQKLAELDAVFVFEPPRQHQLADWVRTRARLRKIAIEPEAARLLADVAGGDLGRSIWRSTSSGSMPARARPSTSHTSKRRWRRRAYTASSSSPTRSANATLRKPH